MVQTTEEILQARGLRNGVPGPHGEWGDNAFTGQNLKAVIRAALRKRADDGIYPQLAAIHLEALDMLCLKIARIATGDANEPDHWQDIEGYAKLCRERLGVTIAERSKVAPAAVAPAAGGSGVGTGADVRPGTSAPAAPRVAPVPGSLAAAVHRTEEQEKRLDGLSASHAVRQLSDTEAKEYQHLQTLRPAKKAWGDILRSADSSDTGKQ